MQKLKETRYSIYIYQDELDKAFFEHGTALPDKVIDFDKKPNYNEYQLGIASTI